MSRTEQLRRLARRLRVEEGRLRKIAAAMVEGNLTMNADEVGRLATAIGAMSLTFDCLASQIRDPRGAPSTMGGLHLK